MAEFGDGLQINKYVVLVPRALTEKPNTTRFMRNEDRSTTFADVDPWLTTSKLQASLSATGFCPRRIKIETSLGSHD